MHPILFEWGPIRLSSYGLLVALGFILGIQYIGWQARKDGKDPNVYMDLSFYLLLGAILGARVFYVAINWSDFSSQPLAIFKIWQGGLVFYGGLIASFTFGVFYLIRHRLDFWTAGDIVLPAVPLGYAIGRWGCFFAGCCYGKPAGPGLPWAVTFTNPKSLAPLHVALHPAQVYASISGFLLFGILFWLKRHRSFKGQVMIAYLTLYPVFRSVEEIFRGDRERKFLPLPGAPEFISTAQAVSAVVFLGGCGLYLWVRNRRRTQSA